MTCRRGAWRIGVRGAVLAWACAAGCGPGRPAESASGTSEATDASAAAASGAVTTSGAPSTTADGETTSAVSGSTTGEQASSTTSAATSTGASTGTTSGGSTTAEPSFETCGEMTDTGVDDVPADVAICINPQINWLAQHVDCALDCSDKTLVHGEGPAASLVLVSQITFDIGYGPCGYGLLLRRLYLGHPSAPKATVSAYLECGLDPWIGAHPVVGWLADQTPFKATLTIDGYSGDWNSPDPVDPPRLFGSFSGDLVGPFEATHCALNDGYLFACE